MVKPWKIHIVSALVFLLCNENLNSFLTRVRKLFKGGNYMRKYGIPILVFIPVANLMHHPLVVILGFKNGHDFLQNPQLPWPPICSNFSSTFVEHQYFPSGSVSLMQVFLKVITLLEKVLVADSYGFPAHFQIQTGKSWFLAESLLLTSWVIT